MKKPLEFSEAEKVLFKELFGENRMSAEDHGTPDRATFRVNDWEHNQKQLDSMMPMKKTPSGHKRKHNKGGAANEDLLQIIHL